MPIPTEHQNIRIKQYGNIYCAMVEHVPKHVKCDVNVKIKYKKKLLLCGVVTTW